MPTASQRRAVAREKHSVRQYDRNVSPVGWYVGSYLLRFVELGATGNNDLNRKFLSWENTILIQARSLDHAFDKVVKTAKAQTHPYQGGSGRVRVRWIFEGVTELLPIYEALEDGSEIMWCDRGPRTLRSLKKRVKPRTAFKQ